MLISGAEKSNPEALLELERENLRQLEADFNQSMASQAALSEKLMTQVKSVRREADNLRSKTRAALQAGERERAAQMALKLKALENDLEQNEAQMEDAEAAYRDMVRTRDKALEAARRKIQEIARSLRMAEAEEATAALQERASGVMQEIGDGGDTLNRLEEMVEEKRQLAAGRTRLAKDSMPPEVSEELAAEEETALADAALAEFAAAEGLSLGSDTQGVPETTAAEEATEEPQEPELPSGKQMGSGEQT